MDEIVFDNSEPPFFFTGGSDSGKDLALKLLRAEPRFLDSECHGVAVFDGNRQLLGHKMLVVSGEPIVAGEVMERAFEFANRMAASNLMIIHNHLDQTNEPTRGDEALTAAAGLASKGFGVHFRGMLLMNHKTHHVTLLKAAVITAAAGSAEAAIAEIPPALREDVIAKLVRSLDLGPEFADRLRKLRPDSDPREVVALMEEILPRLQEKEPNDPRIGLLLSMTAAIKAATEPGEQAGITFGPTPTFGSPAVGQAGQPVENPYKLPRFMRPPGSDKIQ